MNDIIERAKQIASKHQLTLAILLTIAVAFLMTAVSLSLYVSSGTLQLDLSRPGYEAARKELIKPEDKQEFATSGPINKQALEEYQKQFDAQRTELNRIGKFKNNALDDDSLTLSPEATQQQNQ